MKTSGVSKYKKTMIKKFGSEEAWKEYLREIASTGGKNGRGYAFAHGKVSPVDAGRIGGSKSRRNKV